MTMVYHSFTIKKFHKFDLNRKIWYNKEVVGKEPRGRKLNKMKINNNSSSEGALKIRGMISILITLVITGTSIGLYLPHTMQVASVNVEETEPTTEIIVADAGQTTAERQLETTSRGSEERVIEEPKKQYISIDEIEISRDMDLTARCGISKEDFKTLMEDLRVDYSGFFAENAETIYDLCEKYEINEIFFCGLIAAESGWDVASNHRNTHNYISMMSGGRLIRYDSDAEGLEAAARLLHEDYLSEDGAYYYGTSIYDVQTRFCPGSSTWVGLVFGCMNYIVD